jgi:hypothetical protein
MRCPVCKADNNQGPNCRRCKADLSLLFALEVSRRHTLNEARRRFLEGQWTACARLATEANCMQSDDESQMLLALAYLFNGQFAVTWDCCRAGRLGSSSAGSAGL